MCQVLEVSENGYNNWRKRGKSKRKQYDEFLAERIEDAYHHHRGHYGSPRIYVELREQGIHCSKKRVARIMREKQLIATKKGGNCEHVHTSLPGRDQDVLNRASKHPGQ
jgi:putative transposase